MNLTPSQFKQIQEALLDAYTSPDDLRIMVRLELDRNLAAIAGGENLRVVMFNLISWAEQHGRVDDLVRGAANQVPGNPAVQKLRADAEAWKLPAPSSAPPTGSQTHSPAQAKPASIDVFLSYSRHDSAAMHVVLESLRAAGLSVWTDEGLEPGTKSWRVAIEEAVGQVAVMVVLLSPHAKASEWVDNEVGYAQAFGKRIFPVLVAGDNTSAVPISLIRVQWIDGRNDVGQTAMQELRLVLLRNLGRQSMDVAIRIEFDWVTIPAGEFLMGSNKKKGILVDDSERPQHKLYLPAYRIACTPVTNAQYKRFIQATNYEPPEHWEKGSIPHGKKDHPVVYVSWQDAQAFCRWAGVRLPTEAEWEKAARGTDGRIYPWGNQKPDNALCNCAFKASDTTPVGAYPKGASPFGVLDMAGNVWEWTSSKIADYPYKADDGRQELDGTDARVLRGGGFADPEDGVRCSSRLAYRPDTRYVAFGFRVMSPTLDLLVDAGLLPFAPSPS